MLETTFIKKVKRPSGTTGLWSAYVFGEDEHGLWLFSPAGSLYKAEHGDRVVGVCEVGQGNRPAGVPVMHLVPRRRWWFAHVYGEHEPELFEWAASARPAEPGRRAVAIDVCRPPELLDGAWTYVDLELDLLADGAGAAFVDDEDEFAEQRAAGIISATDAATASAVSAEMLMRLRSCQEPFGLLAWERLAAAIALRLPPLTHLP